MSDTNETQKGPIGVIDYGVNNVGSVVNALRRAGVLPVVVKDEAGVRAASALVLPGVGAFDTGVKNLRELGMFDAIKDRVANEKVPLMGICLGMQLLSKGSEEGTLEGLGLVPATTRRFAFEGENKKLKVPHMGWNETRCTDADFFQGLLDDETRFYYVHSYHVVCEEPADVAAKCHYGIDFTAAVHRGHVFGTQFHPEKSHRFGVRTLGNYVRIIGHG